MLFTRLLKTIARRTPGQKVSIIICSIDDRRFENVAENYRQRMGDWPYELIRIKNTPSLAHGYNQGMERSTGEFLIFSHDDIEILTPDFCTRLLAHLESFDLVGVAGTSRLLDGRWISAGQPWIHGQVMERAPTEDGLVLTVFGPPEQRARGSIQALDGVFLAARRRAAESLRFDEKMFDGFHLYDIDFSYRTHLAGLRVGVCNDILIYHDSLGRATGPWPHYQKLFEEKFRGRLAAGEPGVLKKYAQERVGTKAEALALFQQHLKQCAITETESSR
jgi:cellulose synthase/poly-beta-1,6-N-acetylglucosamine synthase-like glycosyltransferase